MKSGVAIGELGSVLFGGGNNLARRRIGEAMHASGTDLAVMKAMSAIVHGGHYPMLIAIYVLSVVLTNMITAKAAAVLVLQIAITAAETMQVKPEAMIVAVIMGAAGSFATPFGYQTNMMVYGPGGYRSSDYLRLGIPLSIIVGIVTVLVAPVIWPMT